MLPMHRIFLSMDGTQRILLGPMLIRIAWNLIAKMDYEISKYLNALKSEIWSKCSNFVSCRNLGLKLDDPHLELFIVLSLGANISVAHTCQCRKKVERDRLHCFSCNRSTCRFACHANHLLPNQRMVAL